MRTHSFAVWADLGTCAGCLLLALVARWGLQSPVSPAAALVSPAVDQHQPASHRRCGPGLVTVESLASTRALRAGIESDLDELERLRASYEYRNVGSAREAQAEEVITALLDNGLRNLQGHPRLESIDCSDYPCEVLILVDTPWDTAVQQAFTAGMQQHPSWSAHTTSVLSLPLGDDREVVGMAVWSDEPDDDQRAAIYGHLMHRMEELKAEGGGP